MLIYLVTNTVTNDKYVGKTTRRYLSNRWASHVHRAKSGASSALYDAMREFGVDAFRIAVLSRALNKEVLDKLERFWIKELGTNYPNGYNRTCGGSRGFRYAEAARVKMSAAASGRKPSAAAVEGVRKAWLGRKHTDEERAKISEGQRGRKLSSETRQKISVALRKRRAA
jgi:group I intron endonuclease